MVCVSLSTENEKRVEGGKESEIELFGINGSTERTTAAHPGRILTGLAGSSRRVWVRG